MNTGWINSTRNSWAFYAAGIHVASVKRHPSWRGLGLKRPWVIEVFGNRFFRGCQSNEYGDLEKAKRNAERLVIEFAEQIIEASPNPDST